MDELGSYPRLRYHKEEQTEEDEEQAPSDQNGSWFGLAMSGLKFLIANQNNNNINHNLELAHNANNKMQTAENRTKRRNNLQILGPNVLRKQLFDIPEYGISNASSRSNATMDCALQSRKTKTKTQARLTKQALLQFNKNFVNYWNQRSSLHTGTVSDDCAIQSVCSQIIHPSQAQKASKLKRCRSFPLLHSDEYIQNFNKQCDSEFIVPASPPAISSTPDFKLQQRKTFKSLDSELQFGSNYSHTNGDSERDCSQFSNDAIKVITAPMPKSMKSKKIKSDEEEIAFSDWSNISSNVGVAMPKFYNNLQ